MEISIAYISPKEALNQNTFLIVHFKCIDSNELILIIFY